MPKGLDGGDREVVVRVWPARMHCASVVAAARDEPVELRVVAHVVRRALGVVEQVVDRAPAHVVDVHHDEVQRRERVVEDGALLRRLRVREHRPQQLPRE